MISAELAIRALRRDLTVSSLLKTVLGGSAIACMLLGPFFGSSLTLGIVGIGGIWLALSYYSAKGSSAAADSSVLIATGQLEEAELRIEQAVRSFSVFRSAKLLSVHHLAILRHAQQRWQDSALLSQAILRQRLGSMQGLSRSSRLMLADSLLEMNDLDGAYMALSGLYDQRLGLNEAMSLLVVQLDYEARIGAWDKMMHNVGQKVQLAELMPTPGAARSQALLALAARNTGREDWATWLAARAALLMDPNALIAGRPMLGPVFGR